MEKHTMEQKVSKEIRFDLTADEKVKMADKAGNLSKERDELTDELKKYNKEKKAQIKELQKDIDRLLDNHVKGFEMREVEVTEVFDWEDRIVDTYFNGEKIESREMHDAELQMKLQTGANSTVKKKKATKKGPKKTKAENNPEKNLTPEELKDRDIQDVIKSETNRNSKVSSIDDARKPYKED